MKAVCYVFLRWNSKRLFNCTALTAKRLPIVSADNSISMSFMFSYLLQVRLWTFQEMVHSSWLLRVDSCKLRSIQQCHCTSLASCIGTISEQIYWAFESSVFVDYPFAMNLGKELGRAQQWKFEIKVIEQKSEKWYNKVWEAYRAKKLQLSQNEWMPLVRLCIEWMNIFPYLWGIIIDLEDFWLSYVHYCLQG